MKKITLTFLAAFMAVWSFAQTGQTEVSWVAADQGYENAEDVTAFDIDENISVVVEQNDGPNAAKYYTSGSALRVYDLNSFTVTAGSKVQQIDKIVLNFVSESYNGYLSTDVETYTVDGATGTWQGVANDVTFINDKESAGAMSNKQASIVSIDVTYTLADEGDDPEPAQGITIDPEGTVQESLGTFTITFNDYGIELVDADNAQAKLTNTTTGNAQTATIYEIGGKKLYISFDETTEAGDYVLSIPANTVRNTITEVVLDELTFSYTIQGAALPDYTVDPAPGQVESISAVTIEFNSYGIELVDADAAQAVLFNVETEAESYAPIYEIGGKKLYIPFDEVKTAGEYILFIEGGTIRNTITDAFVGDLEFTYTIVGSEPAEPTLVELPEGVETEDWQFQAYDTYYEQVVTRPVQVAFNGSDVYLNGLSADLPDAWIKGTLSGDKVTFAANQYMGSFYYGYAEMFFSAYEDVVFDYDAANGTLKTAGYVTHYQNGAYVYDEFEDVVISKVNEVAGTPANPAVTAVLFDDWGDYLIANIPAADTEGNALAASKLSYIFYVEDGAGQVAPLTFTTGLYYYFPEDLTEIPYTYTDDYDVLVVNEDRYVYLNQGQSVISSWNKIGVKSIYRGGGEEHESEIGWFNIQEWLQTTGISSVADQGAEVRYFDLQGRVASQNATGLLIKQVRDAQGNVKNVKVIKK